MQNSHPLMNTRRAIIFLFISLGLIGHAAAAAPTPTPMPGSAVMVSPAPGSTFTGSTVTFQWTAGGATQYALTLGNSPKGLDIYSSGQITALSTTATNRKSVV